MAPYVISHLLQTRACSVRTRCMNIIMWQPDVHSQNPSPFLHLFPSTTFSYMKGHFILLFQKYFFLFVLKRKIDKCANKIRGLHRRCLKDLCWKYEGSQSFSMSFLSFGICSSERLIQSRGTKRPCRQLSASLNNETPDKALKSFLSFRHHRRKAATSGEQKQTIFQFCATFCHQNLLDWYDMARMRPSLYSTMYRCFSCTTNSVSEAKSVGRADVVNRYGPEVFHSERKREKNVSAVEAMAAHVLRCSLVQQFGFLCFTEVKYVHFKVSETFPSALFLFLLTTAVMMLCGFLFILHGIVMTQTTEGALPVISQSYCARRLKFSLVLDSISCLQRREV